MPSGARAARPPSADRPPVRRARGAGSWSERVREPHQDAATSAPTEPMPPITTTTKEMIGHCRPCPGNHRGDRRREACRPARPGPRRARNHAVKQVDVLPSDCTISRVERLARIIIPSPRTLHQPPQADMRARCTPRRSPAGTPDGRGCRSGSSSRERVGTGHAGNVVADRDLRLSEDQDEPAAAPAAGGHACTETKSSFERQGAKPKASGMPSTIAVIRLPVRLVSDESPGSADHGEAAMRQIDDARRCRT